MDAFILAAGFGSRLRPLTDTIPKPLVEVGGRTVLEHVARRLIDAGADRLVINVHHLSERIVDFVREQEDFGVEVRFSREPEAPLGTGGGVARARECLRRDAPFFIHNSDILTTIDLGAMYAEHVGDPGRLVTLAAGGRESWRYLAFDERGLFGAGNERTNEHMEARAPEGRGRRLPFAGVHVASPALLDRLTETGAFSIVTSYLRLEAEGHRIAPFDIGDAEWLEIGTPERLEQARGVYADPGRARPTPR